MQKIMHRKELVELAKKLKVRYDWHEPDEQMVTAFTRGQSFDNAGFWGPDFNGKQFQEMSVVLCDDSGPIAEVNLATLFAWACGTCE